VWGSFAALPLLLVWIYLSWGIVLLGAEFAFAAQNLATFRLARQGEEPSPAGREAIGLAAAARIARAFLAGEGAVPAELLAAELDVPVRSVRALLRDLELAGIVAPRGEGDRDGYLLARAPERVCAADVLGALRGRRDPPPAASAVGPAVAALLGEADAGAARILAARTLADLAGAGAAVDPPARRG
jgi:membrane protein